MVYPHFLKSAKQNSQLFNFENGKKLVNNQNHLKSFLSDRGDQCIESGIVGSKTFNQFKEKGVVNLRPSAKRVK